MKRERKQSLESIAVDLASELDTEFKAHWVNCIQRVLERVAAEAVKKEREACAQLAEDQHLKSERPEWRAAGASIAGEIRARTAQPEQKKEKKA